MEIPAVEPNPERLPLLLTRTRSAMQKLPAWIAPLCVSIVFLAAALALIPRPGLQNDELFFSGPIFRPELAAYSVAVGSKHIPLMVISYTGALKTWLYAVLFRLFAPNVWSVRAPVALMGIGTIWLTWMWTRRIAGTRAAWIATVFLATDSMFLMTNVLDWGPVAIQHLLLMAGLVSFQRWISTASKPWVVVAFFLWGLGMWDKALLSWPLIGLSVACLLAYPVAIWRNFQGRIALTAACAFLIGMLPLLIYNAATRGETASANAKFSGAGMADKLITLRRTIDGSALFGYIVDSGTSTPRTPTGHVAAITVAVSKLFGRHQTNWMLAAWFAALLCLAALWRSPLRKSLLFLLITSVVIWLQMAFTNDAGASAHHVILMWPFPLVFLGIAFSGIAERLSRSGPFIIAAFVALLVIGNMLNTNEYLAELATYGGIDSWTDAIYPLSASLDENRWTGLVDWGYLNALEALHAGRARLFMVARSASLPEIGDAVRTPGALFIQHTADKELFPGVNERLRKVAESEGYVERVERIVRDRNGRPVFELFHFEARPAT